MLYKSNNEEVGVGQFAIKLGEKRTHIAKNRIFGLHLDRKH